MDEFMQQNGQLPQGPASPFAMEQMRRELELVQQRPQRQGSPGWASEFHPEEQARMESAFQAQSKQPGFNPAEFARFQAMNNGGLEREGSPMGLQNGSMNGYQRPMGGIGMGGMGMGGMGMGMGGMGMMNNYGGPQMQQQPDIQEGKGKGRMLELDDEHWEEQFAQIDKEGDAVEGDLDEEAQRAMERELNEMDRSVTPDHETDHYGDFESIWKGIQAEHGDRDLAADLTSGEHLGDMANWDDFDVPHLHGDPRDPQLGDYMFEEDNAFMQTGNPFDEGMRIMHEGGNLSLAALAFEAAAQKDPTHTDAWVMLGSAQAQNEKESPAIRALEQALKLDPNNLQALMGLAVSYTNEGYDSTAYRTLERWLSTKYPQIISPNDLTPDGDIGFTDRHQLHEKVTNQFIEAAQLSPNGEQMDPDVQVGLGVLFYGAEEYDKAVDCFAAALASTESGTSNQQDQIHLLWNRLGATLANSGRSEEAINAYEKALTINPNFVRARYNLGVSCINIGCYEEAAQHLLGALAMHKVVEENGRERAREVVGGGVSEAELEHMIQQNQSTNLYDTLRRVFSQMGRRDLSEMVVAGMDVEAFKGEFDF
jgi:tetratricopeptide (TPR) repeat protein